MKLFGNQIKAAGEGIGEAAEKIGDAMDKNFTTKEERMEQTNAEMANARELQKVAFTQNDNFTKRAIYYLAYFWSFAAVLYIFFVSFFEIPEANQRLVDTITGFLLGTIIAAIINFFFGSSHGSQVKSQQMDGLVKRFFNRK